MPRPLCDVIPTKTDSELMKLLQNADQHTNKKRGDEAKFWIFKTWEHRGRLFQEGSIEVSLAADGVLSAFGYRVGDFGIKDPCERQRILNLILEANLPPVREPAYVSEWGLPRSSIRKRKLVKVLLGLKYGASRTSGNHLAARQNAISAWQSDIQYLQG